PAQKKPGDRYWCIDEKTYHPYTPKEKDFYTTDAFTNQALKWLDEYKNEDKPFLLYMAYTAPHNPLMAWPKDIAKYRGKYRAGYESIRDARYKRQVEMGLLDPKIYPLSKRESPYKKKPKLPDWEKLSPEDRDQEDLRMAVYAAMIDRMDQNIGRILAKIRELGEEDNTLVLFCSDNGGSFEHVDIGSGEFGPTMARWVSVDPPWANVSNTPFRKYKTFSHEGGICTPLIVSWPKNIKKGGQICRQPGHFIDVMPTLIEITGADYPTTYHDTKITPLQGISLTPAFHGQKLTRNKPIFWQWHRGRAVRDGKWKLVSYQGPWELYDLSVDRTETKNLAKKHPEIVKRLSKLWQKWYDDCYPPASAEKKLSKPVQQVKMPSRGICAHRGASDTHPENTLAAFREAVRLGAHQIEMDVQLTKDGKLVVIHDTTVDRTTDGTGKVSDLTLTEIKRLDAGKKKHARFTGSRVPTLAEALAIMPKNIWLNLHLKGKNQKLGKKVAREVMKQNRVHQAFLACGTAAAKGARKVCPDILICNMENQGASASYIDDTIKKKCRFIQLRKKLPSPEEMQRLQEAGVSINFYAGPTVKSLKKVFAAGVHFPLVNDVAQKIKEAEKYGVKPLR
ncbi:MAG: sulfatase-like hydrolase/transferase, partial [Planctomycetia bacterium]